MAIISPSIGLSRVRISQKWRIGTEGVDLSSETRVDEDPVIGFLLVMLLRPSFPAMVLRVRPMVAPDQRYPEQ